ncbi:hypothetical protein NM688_g5302 [Phlebia brevispora]|uniref:Uncharacterized protein n=1 Tax=Phlebia brevispora TaxID=194682 RepID=A0ACC1SXJ2_9APHY|nr:hypothetical protein NM688_g5302 [Phlebia brevispora]
MRRGMWSLGARGFSPSRSPTSGEQHESWRILTVVFSAPSGKDKGDIFVLDSYLLVGLVHPTPDYLILDITGNFSECIGRSQNSAPLPRYADTLFARFYYLINTEPDNDSEGYTCCAQIWQPDMAYLPLLVLLLSSVSSLLSVHAAPAGSSDTSQDVSTVTQRRITNIIAGATEVSSISSWLSTLGSNGQWPTSDIDYTSGCDAQQANWPAQEHWNRIVTLSAAWFGGLSGAQQFAGSSAVRSAISLAMGFWFANDFTDPSCIDSGGDAACPCGTPGFWNPNWFSNVIGIPGFVGEACLLLGDSLLPTELGNCTKFTGRSFATFETGINGVSAITGANALDIASIGLDEGLLTQNVTLISDAFDRVHAEVVVQNAVKADGIRADGSFGQHTGIIYNGNYGKDYANDVFDFELEAAGTQFQASGASRTAFETLWTGNPWMVYRNIFTNVLHWDFSVLGRFISFPVADNQATASLKTNFTQLQLLAQEWDSAPLTAAAQNFALNTTDANSGAVVGNMMFYANDFMVQRGPGYVTSLRMYSTRTQNTECTNSQNPFGFHLSDGTVYTHLNGDEYEDIAAAWDWNLIPGITVDYGATTLDCSDTRKTGTQSFVGGASDGMIGVAAMRYETPTTKTLNWRKTWFFLENDVQHVMVARITSSTSAPVFSVLDQRKLVGDVFVNGAAASTGNFSSASSLWHGGVGYSLNVSDPVTLSLDIGPRTGDWLSIGISTQPNPTVDMFAAWLAHNDLSSSLDYTVFPGTTFSQFQQKVATTNLVSVRNDGSISALVDTTNQIAMLVFWETDGGSVTIPTTSSTASLKVQSNGSSNVIIRMASWAVTVADPTQLLSTLTLNFTLGSGTAPSGWGSSKTKSLTFALPSGGTAGSSLSQSLPS